MLDLILAIIFSAMIPVIMKYAHNRKLPEEVILTFNYFVAIVFSAAFFLVKIESYAELFVDFRRLLFLLVLGIITGITFYNGFYFYQKSVRDHGVSISIAVGKMGIVIPMLLSLLIWNEIPTSLQWIGILCSVIAIGIINIVPKEFKGKKIKSSLFLFLIIGGLADFFNKMFEETVGADYSDLFLCIVFTVALLASLYNTIKNKNMTKESVIFGVAVGIPNMLTAFFLIHALALINATVVFPLYSGGAIMLSMCWSVFAFKEKLSRKDMLAILMIFVALLLINI